jgi:DNA-binding GntR family transcriptional regulator
MQVDKIEEIVNENIAEKLSIPPEQPIICVRRIRLVNNEPIAYQSSYMDSSRITIEQAHKINETKSFYKTLAENNIIPAGATENYSVKEVNDSRIAKLMNIKKNTDTFFVKRNTVDESGKLIEYAETYFNKDWYSVTVEVNIIRRI